MPFVDSNIWVAYLNSEDRCHARSLKILGEIRKKNDIFVTSGIVHEVVNYLFKFKGKAIAESSLDFFITNLDIEIIFLGNESWSRTVELFKKHELSLTDAQIAACMEQMGDKRLYSFDRHFQQIEWIERIG